MVQYTTPQLTLKITDSNVNLWSADQIYVTFSQGENKLTKTGNEIGLQNDGAIVIHLTQEETAMFGTNPVSVQINWTGTDWDGNLQRFATGIKKINFTKNLLNEVMKKNDS